MQTTLVGWARNWFAKDGDAAVLYVT